MESEESFDGLGLNVREETFYPVSIEQANFKLEDDVLGGFIVTTSMDTTQHTRAIYSTLDFLGDVGGLFDMLRLVAQVLL